MNYGLNVRVTLHNYNQFNCVAAECNRTPPLRGSEGERCADTA